MDIDQLMLSSFRCDFDDTAQYRVSAMNSQGELSAFASVVVKSRFHPIPQLMPICSWSSKTYIKKNLKSNYIFLINCLKLVCDNLNFHVCEMKTKILSISVIKSYNNL